MNKDSLNYEMGVLMFNVFNNEAINDTAYDIRENFVGIVRALETPIDGFKEGFVSEAANYCIDADKAELFFANDKEVVEKW